MTRLVALLPLGEKSLDQPLTAESCGVDLVLDRSSGSMGRAIVSTNRAALSAK